MEPKEEKQKNRKARRTKIVLEKDIMDAAKEIIEDVGFANTTVRAIARKAGIEPNVFYNRFESLESMLDFFAQRHDYWLIDVVDIQSEHDDYGEFYRDILVELAKSLYRNKSMQKLLLWELTDNNPTTRRAAGLRESHSEISRKRFEAFFEGSDIDFDVFTALMIGGIYYLILHKKLSTFCGVDFSTQEGKKRLLEAIGNISVKIFEKRQSSPNALEIARRMKDSGIDEQTISACTDLTLETVARL